MQEKTQQLHNLYDYLDQMRIRPAMFIGTYTIRTLHSHINGFRIAEFIYGMRDKSRPDFDNFHDFVAEQYNYTSSGKGWPTMILDQNQEDEDLAIKDFFKLLDVFRNKEL